MRKAKELAVNLALTFAVCVLMLLAFEAGLRIIEHFSGKLECEHSFLSINQRSEDQKLVYELIPDRVSDYECVSNIVNSQGIRVARIGEVYGKKTKYRIIVLGDSVTYGYARQYNETYPSFLEEYLKSRGYDAEVINLGVSGYGFGQYVERLKTTGMGLDPDFILVDYTSSDYKPYSDEGLFTDAPVKCRLPYIGLETDCRTVQNLNDFRTLVFFKTRFENMMAKASEDNESMFKYYRVDFEGEDYGNFLKSVDELKTATGDRPTVVGMMPIAAGWDDYAIEEDVTRLREAFGKDNITTIDFYPYLHDRSSEDSIANGKDVIHYNPEGYRLVAQGLGEYLTQHENETGLARARTA